MSENHNPAKKHHRTNGFQNNYTEATDKSFMEFLRWQFARRRDGLPKPPQELTPITAPNLEFIHANRGKNQQPAITWIGHATMLVQMGG